MAVDDQDHLVVIDQYRPAVAFRMPSTWTWRCSCGESGQAQGYTSVAVREAVAVHEAKAAAQVGITQVAAEFMKLLDDIEDSIASIPVWQHAKSMDRILGGGGYGGLTNSCGCRYYRDDQTVTTTCVCDHEVEWHEDGRRCWWYEGVT